ncbi:MAG: pentapeptide repeat-containing protein [Oculatellaceae cyanobacterium bins.114]|nr:pentapeptide repeat-containing protein [Oculatellaceae cyanobacterium bins.114]
MRQDRFAFTPPIHSITPLTSCPLPPAFNIESVALYIGESMIWRSLLASFLVLWLWIAPAQAAVSSMQGKYSPPVSFSNAELRGRDFSGQRLRSPEFSNANLESANFSNADLQGAVFSASVMTQTNLQGANLSNSMADQVKFQNANLSDAILVEAILLRSTFDNTNITGADFTDAILDGAQVKQLCRYANGVNSQTGVATRESLGCKD